MISTDSTDSPAARLRAGRFDVPAGAPVFDVDGLRLGCAEGVIDDCLVVRHDAVYVDHVPFTVVAGFDGAVVRLAVTADEIHRGDAQRNRDRSR